MAALNAQDKFDVIGQRLRSYKVQKKHSLTFFKRRLALAVARRIPDPLVGRH